MQKELPKNARDLAQFLRNMDNGLAVGMLLIKFVKQNIDEEAHEQIQES